MSGEGKAKKVAKRSTKKKVATKTKLVPDPDASYRDTLDANYYVPKGARENIAAERIANIRRAIDAFTIASSNRMMDEASGVVEGIPIMALPFITRALDLYLTPDQLKQVEAMVKPAEGDAEFCRKEEYATQMRDDDDDASCPRISYASRKKLEDVLLELMHSYVLSFNQQVLTERNSEFPIRASSVVCGGGEHLVRKCFDLLWTKCGGRMTSPQPDGHTRRCIAISDLKNIILENDSILVDEEVFTADGLQQLVSTSQDPDSDVIIEDAFLSALVHVH